MILPDLLERLYWWFSYDVIKNMIIQIIINVLQILVWAIRRYNVPLYEIWSHLDQGRQSYGSKKLKDFLYFVIWENEFAHQHGCHNINV